MSAFFSRIDAEGLTDKAFPQDAFLALAASNYFAYLYDLDWSTSPLFFLCPDGGGLAWLGLQQSCEKPTTLVSLASSNKIDSVGLREHALFLSQMNEAYQFINELKTIENKFLKPHLSKLTDVQPQIHKLVVSLSNFLSHVLTQETGAVCSRFNLKDRKCVGDLADIQSYGASLPALLKSFENLGIVPYKTSVLNSYYYLNQKFLDQKTRSYGFKTVNGAKAAQLEVLKVLDSVVRVEDNADSKAQAEELIKLIKL